MKYAHKANVSDKLFEIIKSGHGLETYAMLFTVHETNDINEIVSYLPKCLQDKSMFAYVTKIDLTIGLKELKPHSHLTEKCVLNIYLKTNGERTIFYEGDEVDVESPDEDQSAYTHKTLSVNHLQEVESFIAKDQEAWLLKTNQPHALVPNEINSVREILQIYFPNNEYDELVELLENDS